MWFVALFPSRKLKEVLAGIDLTETLLIEKFILLTSQERQPSSPIIIKTTHLG